MARIMKWWGENWAVNTHQTLFEKFISQPIYNFQSWEHLEKHLSISIFHLNYFSSATYLLGSCINYKAMTCSGMPWLDPHRQYPYQDHENMVTKHCKLISFDTISHHRDHCHCWNEGISKTVYFTSSPVLEMSVFVGILSRNFYWVICLTIWN